MVVLFEDYKNMPVSRMFRTFYGDDVVYFSEGNLKLKNKLLEILSSHNGDRIVCYVDFVYDNYRTKKAYTGLLYYFRNNRSVQIVKVPCIEFAVYYYLLSTGIDVKVHKTTNTLFYNYLFDNCINYTIYQEKSFEKYCKGITEKLLNKCLKTGKSENEDQGEYYIENCICEHGIYKYCRSLSIIDKAFGVLKCLPVYVDGNGNLINQGLIDYNIVYKRLAEITPLKE